MDSKVILTIDPGLNNMMMAIGIIPITSDEEYPRILSIRRYNLPAICFLEHRQIGKLCPMAQKCISMIHRTKKQKAIVQNKHLPCCLTRTFYEKILPDIQKTLQDNRLEDMSVFDIDVYIELQLQRAMTNKIIEIALETLFSAIQSTSDLPINHTQIIPSTAKMDGFLCTPRTQQPSICEKNLRRLLCSIPNVSNDILRWADDVHGTINCSKKSSMLLFLQRHKHPNWGKYTSPVLFEEWTQREKRDDIADVWNMFIWSISNTQASRFSKTITRLCCGSHATDLTACSCRCI